MDSFNLDRLDPIALEQTLAYLRANPEPRTEDAALFSYGDMLEDAVKERDWMVDETGESSHHHPFPDLETLSGPSLPTPSIHFQPIIALKPRTMSSVCTWAGCDWSTSSADELCKHLELHSTDAMNAWSRGSKCTWQGCKSKANFVREKLYRDHLRNIHTRPLLCNQPGCQHKKPFRDQKDLNRHQITKHATSQHKFECPYDSCEAETRTFVRRDKWLKHIRETQHQDDAFCPFNHCRRERNPDSAGFNNRQEIVDHFNFNHAESLQSSYNCGLGSCGNKSGEDRWTNLDLCVHLITKHGLQNQWESAQGLAGVPRIFTTAHIRHSESWRDCNICAEDEGAA